MNRQAKENHIFPFLWMRGEEEPVLREYVGAIQAANCNAFCVESRPHPDFCGPGWWRDMDIILEEAKSRGMEVWILDDSHFPTGYANGALKEGHTELCRQSVFCHMLSYRGKPKTISLPLKKLETPPKYPQKFIWRLAELQMGKPRVFEGDHIVSVTAFGPEGQVQKIDGDRWRKPEGDWQIAVCGLSRNLGAHRDYINMMDGESCRLLIDQVYEPHWQHYGSEFGKTIAGFFSDEPELGNSVLYAHHNVLGTHQALPWSRPLEEELERIWGADFWHRLPLLWMNGRDAAETARVRVEYMDAVTRLVQKNFSCQIGDWCRGHGVRYIGHVIEDNNTHTCTGASLGHYFRGLSGQDMAGIDCIGGQVLPQGEEIPAGNSPVSSERDGIFYHYMLAKLAASAAWLEPRKRGNAMCEIFGNYGWGLSMREMKYLADHFLVRGINNFVPHAFSMAPFPDPDCPPHFYAHGNNPLYRHAGALFGYMGRVAGLISGGRIAAEAAILYNAEAEWADAEDSMLPQVIGRKLYDRQMDYMILPMDYLDQAKRFKVVIVPACRFLPREVNGLENAIYIDRLPEGFAGKVVRLEELLSYLEGMGLRQTVLTPPDDRVRVLHYQGENELFLLVNEGTAVYRGEIGLPVEGPFHGYDAWEDREYAVRQDGRRIPLSLEPGKSVILIRGETAGVAVQGAGERTESGPMPGIGDNVKELKTWRRSLCRSRLYPNFTDSKEVSLPDDVSKEKPDFSGFIRYETTVELTGEEKMYLEISDARDSVEVFVNGESLGIQIVPPFRYNLSGKLRQGEYEIAIEAATTAAREANALTKNPILKKVFPIVLHQSGIIGTVKIGVQS